MARQYTFAGECRVATRHGGAVFIPDQVAGNPCAFAGRTFPVLRCRDYGRARAKLDGTRAMLEHALLEDVVVCML